MRPLSTVRRFTAHSCKPIHCKACGALIPQNTEAWKVEVATQMGGVNFCDDCWNKVGGVQIATDKNHDATWYNISHNHQFKVSITHNDETLKGYALCKGAKVYGMKDCEYYPMRAIFEDDSHHAITKILDSIYTHGYKVTVTVNGTPIYSTEDCRNALEMKIRNAYINPSLNKAVNVNLK